MMTVKYDKVYTIVHRETQKVWRSTSGRTVFMGKGPLKSAFAHNSKYMTANLYLKDYDIISYELKDGVIDN